MHIMIPLGKYNAHTWKMVWGTAVSGCQDFYSLCFAHLVLFFLFVLSTMNIYSFWNNKENNERQHTEGEIREEWELAFALPLQPCGLSAQRLAQLSKLGLTGCSGPGEWSLCPHWTGERTGLRGPHGTEGSAQASQFCAPGTATVCRLCLGCDGPPIPAPVLTSPSQLSCHSRRASSSLPCPLGRHPDEGGGE